MFSTAMIDVLPMISPTYFRFIFAYGAFWFSVLFIFLVGRPMRKYQYWCVLRNVGILPVCISIVIPFPVVLEK